MAPTNVRPRVRAPRPRRTDAGVQSPGSKVQKSFLPRRGAVREFLLPSFLGYESEGMDRGFADSKVPAVAPEGEKVAVAAGGDNPLPAPPVGTEAGGEPPGVQGLGVR